MTSTNDAGPGATPAPHPGRAAQSAEATSLPAVSVVIPTHRRPELVRRAVHSVMRQTWQPHEILVVDDADDAGTRTAVSDMARQVRGRTARLRYVRNVDGGVSSSRNRGAAMARGCVIALLDDDDYWDRNYLENAIGRLVTTGADAVVTWRADGAEGSMRSYRQPKPGLTAGEVVATNPGVVGSNICVYRSVYRRLRGFDENLPVSNDIDFFVRFLQSGFRYCVVDERLVRVGNVDGPRLIDADQRRVDGMRYYYHKHYALFRSWGHVEMRRKILRTTLRMRRAALPRGCRRTVYTLGTIVLARPRGVNGFRRLLALLKDL